MIPNSLSHIHTDSISLLLLYLIRLHHQGAQYTQRQGTRPTSSSQINSYHSILSKSSPENPSMKLKLAPCPNNVFDRLFNMSKTRTNTSVKNHIPITSTLGLSTKTFPKKKKQMEVTKTHAQARPEDRLLQKAKEYHEKQAALREAEQQQMEALRVRDIDETDIDMGKDSYAYIYIDMCS
jgi:hypothetical protein